MSRFRGPTWTSSHVYGQGFINRTLALCYFNTPKCASMWMRKCISHMDNWQACNFVTDNLDNISPIIILRDPVRRWISASPAKEKILRGLFQDTHEINLFFNNIESWLHDEHSARQTDFIAGLDLSNAVYFYCDQDLSKNIEHFFQSFGINFFSPGPINEQENTPLALQAKQIWQDILSQPKFQHKFREVFAEDYKLIESVKFYRYDDNTR